LTTVAQETMGQRLPIFNVAFFDPQTHNLHSSARVAAPNPMKAVQTAIDHITLTRRGTEIASLPSFTASITDEWGNPIVGLEKALSKAQLTAELTRIANMIALLDDDGQTSAQAAAVQATIPGVQQVVSSPDPANALKVQPTLYTPPQNVTPQSVAVASSDIPRPNAGAFSQADVDAQVQEALKKAGVIQ
jgi:hypothetical protein